LRIVPLRTRADVPTAIRDMWVRGAPLIGATAAYGMALQMDDWIRRRRSAGTGRACAARDPPDAINLRLGAWTRCDACCALCRRRRTRRGCLQTRCTQSPTRMSGSTAASVETAWP
jgi:hypothetical protein